uniref:Uncharacterized protein n=1 Tax=Globisporangium ultimum (strain ATCC 200006 / CBS 805.95 / DAOM BR144) TaxID=431595 RepID=K3W9P3_GLOUD
MTASDFATPASPISLTGINASKVNVAQSKAHGQVVARKIAGLNELKQQQSRDGTQTRRRKRDAFFALFKSSKEAKETTEQTVVPVQIPAGYKNANHKGCLVSGKRVAYSRYMHQGRKSKLSQTLGCSIPEDTQVLHFPPTSAQLKAEEERALAEVAANIRRGLFFG